MTANWSTADYGLVAQRPATEGSAVERHVRFTLHRASPKWASDDPITRLQAPELQDRLVREIDNRKNPHVGEVLCSRIGSEFHTCRQHFREGAA
jgi:hypothetical protein